MSSARRFRRYNETLFALEAAEHVGWQYLSRIQVQKILYLTEMLGPFQQFIISRLEYYPWHRGPYSKSLQNGIDHLVARGLATITYYHLRQTTQVVPTRDDKVEVVQYQITDSGHSLIKSLCSYEGNMDTRRLVQLVCELVDLYGVSNILNLVYEEPTFSELKARGKADFIDPESENNQTLELLSFIDDTARTAMRYTSVTWEAIATAYFDFLWSKHTSEDR